MIVHLLRHGQSTWNIEGRLQGQSVGPVLTDLGIDQVRRAGQQFRRSTPIYSSDLDRALQSARIVAALIGSPVVVDQRLREQHHGELEGRLVRDLEAEDVQDGQDISEVNWGGGESLAEVYARAEAFLRDLADQALDEAIVVSHGVTIRALLRVLDQPDVPAPWRDLDWGRPLANAAIVSRNLTP